MGYKTPESLVEAIKTRVERCERLALRKQESYFRKNILPLINKAVEMDYSPDEGYKKGAAFTLLSEWFSQQVHAGNVLVDSVVGKCARAIQKEYNTYIAIEETFLEIDIPVNINKRKLVAAVAKDYSTFEAWHRDNGTPAPHPGESAGGIGVYQQFISNFSNELFASIRASRGSIKRGVSRFVAKNIRSSIDMDDAVFVDSSEIITEIDDTEVSDEDVFLDTELEIGTGIPGESRLTKDLFLLMNQFAPDDAEATKVSITEAIRQRMKEKGGIQINLNNVVNNLKQLVEAHNADENSPYQFGDLTEFYDILSPAVESAQRQQEIVALRQEIQRITHENDGLQDVIGGTGEEEQQEREGEPRRRRLSQETFGIKPDLWNDEFLDNKDKEIKEAFIKGGHEGKILIYDGLEGLLEGRVEEVDPEKDYLNTTPPPYPFGNDDKSEKGSSLG